LKQKSLKEYESFVVCVKADADTNLAMVSRLKTTIVGKVILQWIRCMPLGYVLEYQILLAYLLIIHDA